MDFWGHDRARNIVVATGILAALVLMWCVIFSLIPRQGSVMHVESYKEFSGAYERIEPGRTRISELAHIGFDAGGRGTKTLSYLGVIERFMPWDSLAFDRLDPGIRSCLDAQDRCTEYVFYIHFAGENAGEATVDEARTSRVTLLIRDGRVAYKAIS